LVGLLVLFLLTGVASAVVVHAEAEREAEQSARADTRFAADLAASEIASALALIESTVLRTAANPGIAAIFAPGATCNITFGGVGVFPSTHLDFTTPSGGVACSSAGPAPGGVSYAGAVWLAEALRGPVFAAPVVDSRGGHVSVVFAAPVTDRGVVAAFADLTDVASTLASRFGGPRKLEFVVTAPDGTTPLSQSRADLDPAGRLYGEAAVGTRGWKVYASAQRSDVASSANSLFLPNLAATSVGLVAFLLGTLLVYRRVVGPIQALSRSVGEASDPAAAPRVDAGGPAEIALLADNFNVLIDTVRTQLADRQRAEGRVRSMLDAALDAVVGMDEAGNVVEWSRQAEVTFGWRKTDVLGRPLVGLIIPERYRAAHIAGLAEYRRTGVGPVLGRRVELEAVTQDGREFPVELSITPARTPAGSVFTAYIRDISERRTAEQQRLALEERLRQSERLEGIGRLAGGIAHDFNNILAVVMNYSQFVEDSLPTDSAVREDVVQIRLAAERGATFTRQLLTFAHRGAVNPQDVQLNTVLGELRTMLRRTIPEKITIDLDLAPDLWTVRIDVGQLEQLVLNLVVNAADAMPDGGSVRLTTANLEMDDRIPTEPGPTPGRYVRLDVTDTGYGMSKDVLARAFEPFFTTKPKGKGTGLGLATAYGIVQQAEGAISIQSVVAQGTTVRVHLPAQVGVLPETARIRASSVPDAAPSAGVIFVVEDEAVVRKAVIRILSDRGYGTLQAAGPTSAMDVAKLWAGPIDLLLTDIVMPGMAGDELARELRKGRPKLRIVYMTGYSGEIDTAALRVDGPVVQKPFTRETLLTAIEEVLATKD
jgi:PAS domain S-box-containing protein